MSDKRHPNRGNSWSDFMRDEMKQKIIDSSQSPDGNVHTIPLNGPEHIESEGCWCQPDLVDDFTDTDGSKHYLHKEIQ